MQVIKNCEELEEFVYDCFKSIIEKYRFSCLFLGPESFLLMRPTYALWIASDYEQFDIEYLENHKKYGYQMIGFEHIQKQRKMPIDQTFNYGPDTINNSKFYSLKVMAYDLEHYCADLLAGDKAWILRWKVDAKKLPSWLLFFVAGKLDISD